MPDPVIPDSDSNFSWDKPASGEQPTEMVASKAGRHMLGGYALIRMIGTGGMGHVYLARDPKLDRPVAIKTLKHELLADSQAKARFLREARAVARLNDPNIIQIYQVGEDGDYLFLVMEYIDGESLAVRIHREGPFAPKQALDIAAQVTRGLRHALANGVIHRDIKPGNVLIDDSGRARIADFGLAKLAEAESAMTTTGASLGTPNYMSPEAARGDQLDFRSDIYSLGIMLYHMLQGTPPHRAPTPASVLLKHIQDPLPEPEDLSELQGGAVLNLLKRMTAKDPGERPASYDELLESLESLKQDATTTVIAAPVPGAAASPPPAPAPWSKTHIAGVAVAAVVIMAAVADMRGRRKAAPGTAVVTASPVPAVLQPTPAPVTVPPAAPDAPRQRPDPGGPGERFPELRDAGRAYSFREAAVRIRTVLGSGDVPAPRRAAMERSAAMLEELASFRDALQKAASVPGARAEITLPDHGRVVLAGATETGFTFRTAAGVTVTVDWPQMRPLELLTLARQLLPGAQNADALRAFEDFYEGDRRTLRRGAGPGSAAQPPSSGPVESR